MRLTEPDQLLPWSRVLDEVTIQMAPDANANTARDETFLDLTADNRPGDLP